MDVNNSYIIAKVFHSGAYRLARQPTKPSKYVYAYSFQTLQVVASGCARPLLQPLIGCRKGQKILIHLHVSNKVTTFTGQNEK